MKFDVDSKLEENRKRYNLDHNRIDKLSSNYSFYIIFLSFIGYYFVDVYSQFKEILVYYQSIELALNDYAIIIIFPASVVCIIISMYYFVRFIFPSTLSYELLPKVVYNDIAEEIKTWIIMNNLTLNTEEEIKKSYLTTLEKAVDSNFKVFTNKRYFYYKTLTFVFISGLLYFEVIVMSLSINIP